MTDPKCSVQPCMMTLGYYVGGGQFICWLHALKVPGCLKAIKGRKAVALIASK